MPTPLPLADPATRAFFEDWLDRFAACVRKLDVEAATGMAHEEILLFDDSGGCFDGLAQAGQALLRQWRRISDFRFNHASARVLTSDDDSMVVVTVTWSSRGYDAGGASFPRPGRATLVFHRGHGSAGPQQWCCVHAHVSLNEGVPQASFGRPAGPRQAALPG